MSSERNSCARLFAHPVGWRVSFVLCCLLTMPAVAHGQGEANELPTPLGLADVLDYARSHRREIGMAQALVRAAEQRPAMVSGQEDPMIMPSIDHLPFMLHGVDASLMVEQRFPLSGVLEARRRAAEAEVETMRARTARVEEDVALDAAKAFFMLWERREMARVLAADLGLARLLVDVTNARYASGNGSQSEVLRAEVEVLRLQGSLRTIALESQAAESMLNASLGRAVDAAIPELVHPAADRLPSAWDRVRASSLRNRPELRVGRAEIGRTDAEIAVMKSMNAPMALVRTGPAYTMTDEWGWMLAVGISIPLWQEKYDAGVREAEAMSAMAHADLDAMTRMVEGEAASSRNLVLAARERVLALRDEVLPRASQALEPSLAAYSAGTAPLATVLDSARLVWSLEAELISAEFDLGVAWARLHRAQGEKGGRP